MTIFSALKYTLKKSKTTIYTERKFNKYSQIQNKFQFPIFEAANCYSINSQFLSYVQPRFSSIFFPTQFSTPVLPNCCIYIIICLLQWDRSHPASLASGQTWERASFFPEYSCSHCPSSTSCLVALPILPAWLLANQCLFKT